MSYATQLALLLTTWEAFELEFATRIREITDRHRERLEEITFQFLLQGVSPTAAFELETAMAEELRELGREWVEMLYNMIEAEDAESMPHDVTYQGNGYRRLNRKTRNAHVATLFGTIELKRYGYRYWHRDVPEKTIFPLEIQLGLVGGATPALAEAAARYMAETGATQAAVLARLKQQHQVSWGAERLRTVTSEISQAMEQFREFYQTQRILELLEQAAQSKGRSKPVLAVGRDGISLREYRHRCFEVATAATLTVYDRRGRRLGTVYLAFAPQLGQQRMTDQLTSLIESVLRNWEGVLPRLCYVTDAGESETKYYRRILKPMRHPRTGVPLDWQRIVDYYHASERIWTMAEALFGTGEQQELRARRWARRMCRLLKQTNGPCRVLHSAAAIRGRLKKISAAREKAYRRAYNYLRVRTKYMQYSEYKGKHLPIGSGVTEAACKTIFTQRLKLSGMRWSKAGAQTILNLRVILLSGVWTSVYRGMLAAPHAADVRTYAPNPEQPNRIAA
jgi:hypothetical protein